MSSLKIASESKTPEVFNQSPPLVGYNLYLADAHLTEAAGREGAGWADVQLREPGEFPGTEEAQRWGFEANAVAHGLPSAS